MKNSLIRLSCGAAIVFGAWLAFMPTTMYGASNPPPVAPLASYSQSCNSTASSRSAGSCQYTLNLVDLGANPNGGGTDNAPIISAAIATAATVGNKVVCAGTFSVATTINWNVPGVHFDGASSTGCLLGSTVVGDVISIVPSPYVNGTYLTGIEISNVRIYNNSANTTSGACIDINQAQLGSFSHINADGCFIDFEVQSSLNNTFVDVNAGGNNSASGSALWLFKRASGSTLNNSQNKVIGSESRAQTSGTYAWGMLIANSDGLQISNAHIGFVSTSAVDISPANSNDHVDGILFDNTQLDTATYGISCTGEPGGFAGALNSIALTGGSTIYNMSNRAVYMSSCPDLTQVNLANLIINKTGNTAIDISSGSLYNLSGLIVTQSNANSGSSSHVYLHGTVSGVNLNGAQYSEGIGSVKVPYNIITGDSASAISALGQNFSGALTGDVSNGTSAPTVTVTTSSTDQAVATTIIPYASTWLPALGLPAGYNDCVSATGALVARNSSSCKQIVSAAANINWQNLTGNEYHLTCSSVVPSAATVALYIEFGESDVLKTASYSWIFNGLNSGNSLERTGAQAAAGINVTNSLGGATPLLGTSFDLDIHGLAGTGNVKNLTGVSNPIQDSTGLTIANGAVGGDYYTDTNPINEIAVVPASGTISTTAAAGGGCILTWKGI